MIYHPHRAYHSPPNTIFDRLGSKSSPSLFLVPLPPPSVSLSAQQNRGMSPSFHASLRPSLGGSTTTQLLQIVTRQIFIIIKFSILSLQPSTPIKLEGSSTLVSSYFFPCSDMLFQVQFHVIDFELLNLELNL